MFWRSVQLFTLINLANTSKLMLHTLDIEGYKTDGINNGDKILGGGGGGGRWN